MTRFGGVVLCGGQSSRMGRPKAWLPWGEETLLQRMVRVLSEEFSPIVVAAADSQELPALPAEVVVVRDQFEAQGPLAGLAAGLSGLGRHAEAGFVTSCDVPLLRTALVRRLTELLGEYEIVMPREGQWLQPLCAVYRVELAGRCRQLVESGQRRMIHLVERSRTLEVDVDSLRDVDPQLESLRNLNTPEEYERLLRETGNGGPFSLDS